jgi:hypothetical protein
MGSSFTAKLATCCRSWVISIMVSVVLVACVSASSFALSLTRNVRSVVSCFLWVGSNGYMMVDLWDPSAQSGGSKSEQVTQCMDLEHCLY